MKNLDEDINYTHEKLEKSSLSSPAFYLKINSNTDFAVECLNHWINIVEAYGADYYIVCDNEKLKERVLNEKNRDKFINTSEHARQLIKNIVDPEWHNVGAAIFTPFLHAKENEYKSIWNIDADDTVMCAESYKCAEMLKQIQKYADKADIDCFSLDMHSSVCERIYPIWTFGVCYCRLTIDYISKILSFNKLFDSKKLKPNDLVVNNIDKVFSILGRHSQIKLGTFYIENLYFRHNDFEIHCYKNQRFVYRNISPFTKNYSGITSEEIERGLKIPERFVRFDFGLTESESLAFLNNNALFNNFAGRSYIDFKFDYVANLISKERKKLILFGAGKAGSRVLYLFRTLFGIEPYAFCDNSQKVIGTEVNGVKVISFDQLKKLSKNDEIYVLITTSAFYNEIKTQLDSNSIECLN